MPLSHIENWIFDLDNTLYRADGNFFSQIDVKITEFVSQHLELDPTTARHLQKEYLAEYGTTLSGLMAEHDMDPADFLHFVHDVDLSALTPDALLRDHIQSLPGRKFIFTNGSRGHAENVSAHLGLAGLFDGSFAIEDADYVPKPRRAPFVKFCDRFDINPQNAIFFEDNLRNLEVPKTMGMTTVLITSQADFSHEPEEARPASAQDTAPWVDHSTDNLTAWLGEYHPVTRAKS
ncbi:MAG: pyrimidine 5'-nucleotidase [Maricaulaceae bacterium]